MIEYANNQLGKVITILSYLIAIIHFTVRFSK